MRTLCQSLCLVFATLPAVAVAQTPPAWLVEQSEFLESTHDTLCPAGTDAMDCARGLRAAAEARYIAGEPWSSDLFNEAALAFTQAGSHADALSTYRRLETAAETPTWRAYAAFKSGELLLEMTDLPSSLQAFRSCLTTIQTNGGAEADLGLFARACLKEAHLQRALGQPLAAVETRNRLLNQPWTARLSQEQVGMVYVENARDCFTAGEFDAGREWFDVFFVEMPNIGATDGRALLWRIERTLSGRPLGAISDEATTRQLEALWTAAEWSEDPGLMVCASNLATIRANRREWQLQEQLIVEARALFNSHEEAWEGLADRRRVETADEMFQGLTMDLIEVLRRRGDWVQLRIVAADLLHRFPGTPFRQAILEAVEEAMRLGR